MIEVYISHSFFIINDLLSIRFSMLQISGLQINGFKKPYFYGTNSMKIL